MSDNHKRFGFVGVGTISNAVARGIIKANLQTSPIALSPRGSQKVERLVNDLGDLVIKCESNQEVVDKCDWIFVGVLPAQTMQVLGELTFRPDQLIVSMVSTATHELVYEACKVIPKENIVRVIPLPAVEHNCGTSLVFPPHPQVKDLFDKLGGGIEVNSLEQFQRMIAITCTMGDIYKRLHVMEKWLVESEPGSIPEAVADKFVTSLFNTFIADAVLRCKQTNNGLDELVNEQTPGGMNEFVIGDQESQGAYEILKNSLNAVHEKLK